MLIRREAVLFELESTYRDSTTPDINDAIFCENIQYENDAKMLERNGPKDTLGARQQAYGGRLCSLSFAIELKGSGTLGVAPEYAKILQVGGLAETIVADTSVTYKPNTVNIPSGVAYYYQDGKLKILRGCVAEVSMNLQAREYGKLNVKLWGHPDNDTDASMPDPNYSEILPPQYVNANLSMDSYQAEVTMLEIDLGNQISKPNSVRTANGVGQIRIASRDVKGKIDPENVINATYNFYNKWETGANFALDTNVVGSTEGNRWRITAPAVYYRKPNEAEREGIRTLDMELGFAESSGDDEFSLIFT